MADDRVASRDGERGRAAPSVQANRALVLVALIAGTFLSSLDITVVGTAMPRVVADLHGMERYGWVFSAYLLTSTAMVPLFGKLSDVLGRRPVFLLGLAVFLLGSLLCGIAPSMNFLIVARAVQGLGGSALYPVTLTIIGDLWAIEQRARIEGVLSLVWGVSSVIGPAVGGAFVTWASWRWAFLVNLPVGLAAGVLLALAYRERVERQRHRLDIAGALLLVGALLATLGALGGRQVDGRLLGLGAVLWIGLWLVERRAAEPVLPPALLRSRVFVFGGLAYCLLGAVILSLVAYMPLHLQGVHGLSPMAAGLLTSPISFSWTAVSFLAGRWIVRAGYRRVLRGGTVLVALALGTTLLAALPTLGWPLALGLFVLAQILVGAGMGLGSLAVVIAVQNSVAWRERGTATATLELTSRLGGTVATATLGGLLVALLAPRLARIAGAPTAEALVDPSQWGALDAAVLVPARAALGDCLRVLAWSLLGVSAVATIAAWLFPDLRVDEERAGGGAGRCDNEPAGRPT